VHSRLSRLLAAKTRSGATLLEHADRPLVDYLRSIIPARDATPVTPTLELVARVLEKHLRRLDAPAPAQIAADFLRRPFLQLADNSRVLYDVETFLNNYMSYIACREAHVATLLTQQCSTTKLLSEGAGPVGPAFVELDADVYQVFAESHNVLRVATPSTLRDAEVSLEPLGHKVPGYVHPPLPSAVDQFRGAVFGSAADAIVGMNDAIWRNLRMKAKQPLFFFTEELSCDVVAEALRDSGGAVYRMLFDPDVRETFLAKKRKLVGSPPNLVLRDSTDFFTYRDGVRLRPLRIDGGIFRDAKSGAELELRLDPAALVRALDDRDVFPDLITAYAALVVLPGVTALGGPSQHEYLPVIQSILLETHRENAFMSAAEEANARRDLSRLIGPALLELSARQQRVIRLMSEATDFAAFEDDVLSRTVRESAGQLEYFSYFDKLYARAGMQLDG
jgi:hypothetical protein